MKKAYKIAFVLVLMIALLNITFAAITKFPSLKNEGDRLLISEFNAMIRILRGVTNDGVGNITVPQVKANQFCISESECRTNFATQPCLPGKFAKGINADGTIVCEAPQ